MATFTQDTLKSQRAKSPEEINTLMAELEAGHNAVRRVQGSGEAVTDPFQTSKVQQAWGQGEQSRRTKAAEGAAQVAGLIDERIAGTANTLNDVYEKYRQSNADLMQKQGQSALTTDFEKEQGMWGVQNERNKLDLTLYQNQTKRNDAISSAWRQGLAEDRLLDAAIEHGLRMQDIDQYFTLIQNELEQDFLDWKLKTETDWEVEKAKMESRASQWGSILGGLMGVGGAVVGAYFGGPAGAVAGGAAGSKIGQGIAGASA